MIRLVAIQFGLFLLPFVVYGLVALVRGRAVSAGVIRADAPIGKLAFVGLLLVIAAFLALAAFSGSSATGVYVPDRFENGRLVPGHIE